MKAAGNIGAQFGALRERALAYWLARTDQERKFLLAGAVAEAMRGLARQPGIASMEFRERALVLRVKPDRIDPSVTAQMKTALSSRNLRLEESAPATWTIRSTGATPTGGTP